MLSEEETKRVHRLSPLRRMMEIQFKPYFERLESEPKIRQRFIKKRLQFPKY